MDDYELDKKKLQRQSWVCQRDYIQLKIKAGLRVRDILTEIPTEELSRLLDYAVKGIEQEIQEMGEADERQAALASLKREYELNGSNSYNWFIRDYYDILCAALQSPRVQPKYKRVDLEEFIENYVDEYVVDDFKSKYGDLYTMEGTEK